jgi:cytochrome c-type biogenesis protein CcmH/NrfF
MTRKHLLTVCLILLVSGSAWPQTDDLEAQAREIESQLIAPCCWRQTLRDHQSPKADAMKQEIRAMLSQGMSPKAIVARFEERYGERILSVPAPRGFNRLAFVMPALTLFAGLVIVLGLIRRWRQRQPAVTLTDQPTELPPDEARLRERIERELDQD